MDDVQLLSELGLRRPVLLFGFTGWNDAGEGASNAIRVLAEHWDATQVAEVDAEPFTDFATVRPFVVIDEGRRQIVWPTVDVWAASLPSTDVLLVIGPEPAYECAIAFLGATFSGEPRHRRRLDKVLAIEAAGD